MNAKELADALASQAAVIAEKLLPNGKRRGNEWKVGSVDGEAGQSLSVNIKGAKAGVWSDFSTGETGDLLDLIAATRNIGIAEAMKDARDMLGVRDSLPKRPEKAFKRPQRPKCNTPKGKVAGWLENRSITQETIAAFKIGEYERAGQVYAVFPYLRDGELVNAKHRNVDNKKDMRQEGGAEPCLFGWHLIEPTARTIAICEGEIDCMTLHQMGIPALSVNAGAGNHQWIENDWDRLDRFSEILIFFDSDEAGQKGANEVVERLGIDRCKVVTLPEKDANEYLQKGAEGVDFWHAIKDAKFKDPEELKQASDFINEVKHMFYPADEGSSDPVLKLDQPLKWFEFRHGEVTVWTGFNGHGKSQLLSQALLSLTEQGERVCQFSGEMTPPRQLKRLVKLATGLDRPTMEYIDGVGRWLHDKFWIFNLVGSATIDRLLTVFLYAYKRYAIRHFVIDSLMMTDVPEDGPQAMTLQKVAVQKLCNFARQNGCHIHLVAHPRKGTDESSPPGKLDVAGSSKITDGADNVFSVWSARKDEADPEVCATSRDGMLELHKQRNGDVQHYTQNLWFDKGSGQYMTMPRQKPRSYVPFRSGGSF